MSGRKTPVRRYLCPFCGAMVAARQDDRLRVHGPRDMPCDGSDTAVTRTIADATWRITRGAS